MARAPFNVSVFPYRKTSWGELEYALLRRSDSDAAFWQGVAGGEVVRQPLDDQHRVLAWHAFYFAALVYSARLQRQDKRKGAPLAQLALHPQTPTVHLDQALG